MDPDRRALGAVSGLGELLRRSPGNSAAALERLPALQSRPRGARRRDLRERSFADLVDGSRARAQSHFHFSGVSLMSNDLASIVGAAASGANPITAIVELGKDLIDKFVPDPVAKAQASAHLLDVQAQLQ